MENKKGLIHLYTGDGKGKTTAAVGLALRGAGAGMRVVFLQLMKGRPTSELAAFQRLPQIRVFRNQRDFGFYPSMSPEEKADITKLHNQNLNKASILLDAGQTDMLVLDEITSAYRYGLLDRRLVERLLTENREAEIVMTGREAEPFLLDRADYITEMKKIRHPYDEGIKARVGIEL